MNQFEQLLAESEKDNIIVIEKHFKSRAKGLCKGNKIGLSKTLTTIAEKSCVYAEELGHYYTTVGNIIDKSKIENRKKENIARAVAYNKLCSIPMIVEAYRNGISDRYELVEYLNITDKFLDEAIEYYRGKYGLYTQCDGVIVKFEPTFGILDTTII
ncbi:hypothetical protein [Clostridium beijerinckii]|uniref:hypothetical protein n=1 Tax=Clostridium beijerinckii TaxID=1520 RepID=UPI000809EFC2|nr:hypothetical protein [Clostridium beijerinckii]OCA99414.1 hypothetical protein BGS1_09245 [Clostridium beijerinckii]